LNDNGEAETTKKRRRYPSENLESIDDENHYESLNK